MARATRSEPVTAALAIKLVREAEEGDDAETGADTVAVGCPFCSTMITDGLSAIGSDMIVKDIAELVWEQIKANDAAIEAKKSISTEATEAV